MDTTLWWLPAAVSVAVGLLLHCCIRVDPGTPDSRTRMVYNLQPLLFLLCVRHAYQKHNILYLVPHPWCRASVQDFVDTQCLQLPFCVEVFSLDDESDALELQ